MTNFSLILLLCSLSVIHFVYSRPDVNTKYHQDKDDDRYMHPHFDKRVINRRSASPKSKPLEDTASFWMQQAQLNLNEKLHTKYNTGVAKNVILFMGDGMSIPTLAASRVYMSQIYNEGGEESQLSFEKFPFTGLSKTYCVDRQVADSACSATAYLCGIKANEGTIGVTAQVPRSECSPSTNVSTHVPSIARWSQLKNKRTGVVTNTRITHASPTGIYGKTAERDWECDTDVIDAGFDPKDCPDIAYQLIHSETGKNLNVIFGGGKYNFLPKDVKDEEGHKGKRSDGVNLIEKWLDGKQDVGKYIWNRDQLLSLSNDTDYVLGLFHHDHIPYHLENVPNKPSVADLTEAAIKLLDKGPNGYFLFVEGGRIDHAHHDVLAKIALDETVQFSEAIQRAVDITNEKDTLIVVTSDHAHTMSVSGYPTRGNDILGVVGNADDGLPYLTLTYANGPGYQAADENGKRPNYNEVDIDDMNFKRPGLAPLESETHGGDDVGIFARGPWSHLFTGVNEQNIIPHIMAYASCVGDGITVCDEP